MFFVRRSELKTLVSALSLLVIGFILGGCAPSASQLKGVIEKNPDIVFSTIEKNPEKFIEVVNKAARKAQEQKRSKQASDEKKRREDEFKNPVKPLIEADRPILGKKEASVTIVEYSDFECSYCSKAYGTIKQIMEEYGDKVRVVYKHLPLEFHPNAVPAARYFIAIGMQSGDKAYKFHDILFEQQAKIKGGESFLKKTARKVGVNMKKLAKDLKSSKVEKQLKSDIAEARKFGFSGTPGFLINGVSLKGAYPYPEFKKVIDRHLSNI